MSKSKTSILNLVFNLILPSIILTKFSSPDHLGALNGLLVAISLPIIYGLVDYYAYRKINFFSIMGLISVLLTGGIGIFHVAPRWLAVKEAAIPGLLGCMVLISSYTKYPVLKLFFEEMMDLSVIKSKFSPEDHAWFENRFVFCSMLLGGTFFISSILNFFLARWIVVSLPGTEAFNKQLGVMNLLSFPVIALPMTIMLMVILWYLLDAPLKKAEISWEDFLGANQK